jgi:hypothetical protein
MRKYPGAGVPDIATATREFGSVTGRGSASNADAKVDTVKMSKRMLRIPR